MTVDWWWWWWWWPSLPAWLGSESTWFLVLNVVVAAIAVLSSRARPSPSTSPRSGGVTRRASSVLLQRLRSFSIFSSYPSACFDDTPTLLQPADGHAAAQETEEEPVTSPAMPMPLPRALVLTSQPAAPAAEEEEEEEEDPSAMSMEDAYALVLASRRPPSEPEREDEEARRSDVDAKEDLRQQRLNSIFNYTQMLKQRALGAGRHKPDARRDQL